MDSDDDVGSEWPERLKYKTDIELELILAVLRFEDDDVPLATTVLSLANTSVHPLYHMSLSLLADITIACGYPCDPELDVGSQKFELSLVLHRLLLKVLHHLRLDKVDISTIDNSPAHWEENLKKWVPYESVQSRLDVLYPAACILILALHRLFLEEDLRPNVALNPFLEQFCVLWNNMTDVLTLGLEIDRRLESEDQDQMSPFIVIETLRGSSAVRYVLGYILNSGAADNVDYHYDVEVLTLEEFMTVSRRKCINGGSLQQDFDGFVFSNLLARVGMPPSTVVEEVVDAEIVTIKAHDVEDRYDEDLNYIFDEDDDPLPDSVDGSDREEPGSWSDDEFDDANEHDNDTELTNEELHKDGNKQLDWKDIPRGANSEITDDFKRLLDSRPDESFFTTPQQLQNYILDEKSSTTKSASRQKFLNTISAVIYQPGFMEINMGEFIDFLFSTATGLESLYVLRLNSVIPVHGLSHFEVLMHFDIDFACCLFDELLMTPNKRRNLIWTLCHRINLSHNLINYVFELLTKKRGTGNAFAFSRKSHLVLSEVEESMLIHEFLSGASEYVSSTSGVEIGFGVEMVLSETVANKLVTMLCLMINKLVDQGVITIKNYDDHNDIRDYTTSIKNFAIEWIARNKDARELFFRLEPKNSGESDYLEMMNAKEVKSMRTIVRVLQEEGYDSLQGKSIDDLGLLMLSEYIDEFRDRIFCIFHVYNKRVGMDSRDESNPLLQPSNLAQVSICIRSYMKLFNHLRSLDYFHDEAFLVDESIKILLDQEMAQVQTQVEPQPKPAKKKKAKKQKKHKKK